jgi:hypothetical protein
MSRIKALPPDVTFRGRTRDASAVVDPRLKESLELWSRGERCGDLVLRGSISIEKLRTSIGSMGIVDVVPGDPQGLRYRYRLYGLHLAESTGEHTGRWAEHMEPPSFGRLVVEQYDETVRARVPLLHTVLATNAEGTVSYERLTVPLSTGGPEVAQLWMITAGIGPFGRKLWGRRPYFTG